MSQVAIAWKAAPANLVTFSHQLVHHKSTPEKYLHAKDKYFNYMNYILFVPGEGLL
jgi:hypothetical protein